MNRMSILLALLALALAAAGCTAVIPEETPAQTQVVEFCDVVDPSQVHLDIEGLPYFWQAECVPLTSYDQSQPPGPVGMPQHVEVRFNAATPVSASLWREPIIYILPVEQYIAMWDANGNSTVRDNLETLRKTIALKPATVPTDRLPVLPMEEVRGVVDFSTAGEYVDFGTWDGVRMVARMAQDANPITNQNSQYIFQGFAGQDDELFVSFFYPVSTPFLWPDVASMPQEEMAKFNADPAGYIEQQATALDPLADCDWDPPLDTLDEVIGALEYGPRGASAAPPKVVGNGAEILRFYRS